MRKWALALGLAAVVAIGGLAIWRQINRVHFVQTLCEAGLPNLSRPRVVPADQLGCAVLGPTRRVAGFVETSFENSTLIVGPRPLYDQRGLLNETAWFTATSGLATRGGEALRLELSAPRPGLCGRRMAAVVVEGWMTVSEGGFGHLNLSPREFYAGRVLSASPPSAEILESERRELSGRLPTGACEWLEANPL